MSREQVIDKLVDKYMSMLSIKGKKPKVEVRNNFGSDWLGVTNWSSRTPDTTTITLQEVILFDERTLERVVAHEMVHHQEFVEMTDRDREMIKLGVRPLSHGSTFRAGAAVVNAVMGEGFVTEKSDREYVKAPSTTEYYVLISKPYYFDPARTELGWAWGQKLSPQMKEEIQKEVAKGGKLVRTTDDSWTSGTKIKKYGGMSLPKSDEKKAALRRLYEDSPAVTV